MKTIWNVEMRVMNGTVTMQTITHAFSDKDLAEKASEAIKYKNKDSEFPVVTRVYESILYEFPSEVPILNVDEKEEK